MSTPERVTELQPGIGKNTAASTGGCPVRTLNILVAEDNVSNQRFLALLLATHGHSVAIASNGREAVDQVQRRSFDVVLMDSNMPEMEGVAATRAIRALPSPVRSIPIIALTADALASDRDRCLAAGMNAFVTKPIDVTTLLATIHRVTGIDVAPIGDRASALSAAVDAVTSDAASAEVRRLLNEWSARGAKT